MKNTLFLLAFCCLLAGGYNADKPHADSADKTSLPLKSNEWKKIGLNEAYNSDTFVLELQHGWLVYRRSGFGGGMTFVPIPK